MDAMAHKRLFANQKTQTQTCHCHSTSWTKARDLHFKKDLPKKRQVSNSLYPNSKGRKTHKAHRKLDGVQHLPFSTIKAGWGAKHCSPLCWGRQSIPSASGLCSSSVHLHLKCNKNRKEGHFVSCGLKNPEKKKWVRAAIKQD